MKRRPWTDQRRVTSDFGPDDQHTEASSPILAQEQGPRHEEQRAEGLRSGSRRRQSRNGLENPGVMCWHGKNHEQRDALWGDSWCLMF